MGKTRVLVVDDEVTLSEAIVDYLTMFGMDAACVFTASDALEALTRQTFDLIVLDINLPDDSGFELCRQIRATSPVLILFTSVRDSEADVLAALSAGGDDHLAKPFSLAVLLAKIQAMMRRSPQAAPPADTGETGDAVSWGQITVRLDQSRVFGPDGEIPVTGTEYRLLEALVRNRGRVLSKDELASLVWDGYVGEGTLSTHIRRLREKVEKTPNQPRYLKTVWGTGYLLDVGEA
ncbi:MAG: response regulator transcription factor [Propionibacteriaceae bacterium]|nr:response regulator transcription factor [Propionibacteriaceae bacterium]